MSELVTERINANALCDDAELLGLELTTPDYAGTRAISDKERLEHNFGVLPDELVWNALVSVAQILPDHIPARRAHRLAGTVLQAVADNPGLSFPEACAVVAESGELTGDGPYASAPDVAVYRGVIALAHHIGSQHFQA